MINTQPPESSLIKSDGSLEIVNIFHGIVGDGPSVGLSAVTIELAGCNLKCPSCNTNYTSNRRMYEVQELIKEIGRITLDSCTNLVVLSGGEPMRQHLLPFVRKCFANMYKVQIETNGSYCPDLPYGNRYLTIVCSPKTSKIHSSLLSKVDYWKYIVQSGKVNSKGLPTSVLGMDLEICEPPRYDNVYIQPLDEDDEEKNKDNLREAISVCLRHGYRLSVQLQKITGI